MKKGVNAIGITAPIIREGDNIPEIVAEAVLKEVMRPSGGVDIDDKAIVGITESIVARAQGNYATVDDIAESVRKICGDNATIVVNEPIYSRNRFAIILKGIARAAKKVRLVLPKTDEVGNVLRDHPFTKMDYEAYYRELCENERSEVEVSEDYTRREIDEYLLICSLHNYEWAVGGKYKYIFTLADILSDRCKYGVLGSNKVDEERIKLFPKEKETELLVQATNSLLKKYTGRDIIVCVYGDGCFKDPVGGIWEFADPVTMPAYTHKELLESTPNELKVKALADDKYRCLEGDELNKAIEEEIKNKQNLMGKMVSQGTTPRLYRDLLASLMDLTSGSGDRCTPIVLIRNYF